MATRFGKFQTLAQKLITKNARSVTYQVTSTTPAVALEPWGPNTAPTSITIPAVFLEYKSNELNFRNPFGVGGSDTLVQMGDKRCLVAKLDLPNTQPNTKDTILDGTTQWKIMSVKTLQPGNVAETIMYELQLRS